MSIESDSKQAFEKWINAAVMVANAESMADEEVIPTWPVFCVERSPELYPELTVGAVRAWQASRQALSSCSEIPNHSVTGNAVAMGDLTDNDDEEHERSILIQFGSLEDFYAARASGQCRFTLFGSGV